MEKKSRFLLWIIFGLLLSILPIAVSIIYLIGFDTSGITWSAAFFKILSKGELLLVCFSLLGANIADLLYNECTNKLAHISLIGFSSFLCFAMIFLFPVISTTQTFDKNISFNVSWIFLILSAVMCTISLLTERK